MAKSCRMLYMFNYLSARYGMLTGEHNELARFKLGKSASRPGLIFLKMSRVGSKMWKIEPLGWGTYGRKATTMLTACKDGPNGTSSDVIDYPPDAGGGDDQRQVQQAGGGCCVIA